MSNANEPDLYDLFDWLDQDYHAVRRLARQLRLAQGEIRLWKSNRQAPGPWKQRAFDAYKHLIANPEPIPPEGQKSAIKTSWAVGKMVWRAVCEGPTHDPAVFEISVDTEPEYPDLDSPIQLSIEGVSEASLEFEPEEAEAVAHALLKAVEYRRQSIANKLKLAKP